VAYESADEQKLQVRIETTRTFLPSSLENDLKYRLGVQEFYLDKVHVVIKFVFNQTALSSVRGCESLLRMNYLPIRIVKRLVERNHNVHTI
jgi:hypothetical protein